MHSPLSPAAFSFHPRLTPCALTTRPPSAIPVGRFPYLSQILCRRNSKGTADLPPEELQQQQAAAPQSKSQRHQHLGTLLVSLQRRCRSWLRILFHKPMPGPSRKRVRHFTQPDDPFPQLASVEVRLMLQLLK